MYTVYFIFFQVASATATRFGLSRGLLVLQYDQINESESESESDYVGRKILAMVPHGRRKRGRAKQRWMDCVNRDTRAIGTTSDKVHDRAGWRRIVSAAATHVQL